MRQIYETKTIEEYQSLIGETILMFGLGCAVDEISKSIKQPVDKVIECIRFCESIF